MSIQTGVFVNGEWTTRSVDIHEIIARNRNQVEPEKRVPEPKMPEQIPELGILSRTVFRSPLVNWILQARIRHKNANDVVFIGEDYVHLKEIHKDGHLCHIATKSDFDSRIRAARIFGEPKKAELQEQLDADLPSSSNVSSAKLDQTQSDGIIPPQVIVLTLESRKLMFLYAQQDDTGAVKFCQSTLAFPPGKTFLEQPGKLLTVDAKSRAIAVSAWEGSFIIYATSSMSKWREDTARFTRTVTPVGQERAFKMDDATILKMEFLSPESNDENHVILLVIFSSRGKVRLSCYDWDASKGLQTVVVRADRIPIDTGKYNSLYFSIYTFLPPFNLTKVAY